MKPLPVRYTAHDIESCGWDPNCGPGALAGVLNKTFAEIRPHMGDFEKKHYTNVKVMYHALKSLGVEYALLPIAMPYAWPARGLARVQWGGPWMRDGAHWSEPLRHSHWIGCAYDGVDLWICDINCACVGGWVSFCEWSNQVVPWLLKLVEPETDGSWSITHLIGINEEVGK